jgi:hypothetical protein
VHGAHPHDAVRQRRPGRRRDTYPLYRRTDAGMSSDRSSLMLRIFAARVTSTWWWAPGPRGAGITTHSASSSGSCTSAFTAPAAATHGGVGCKKLGRASLFGPFVPDGLNRAGFCSYITKSQAQFF